MYADDAGVVSRASDSLVNVMTDIVAVCASFGLGYSEAKTATMRLMVNGMGKITSDTEVADQVYKRTAKAVCLGATVCEDVHHTYCRDQPARATGQATPSVVWPATVRPLYPTSPAHLTDRRSIPKY